MSNLTTASVLAFERNLDITDGFLEQANSEQPEVTNPVIIRDKSVRGTISNRLKNAIANDPAKLDAEIQKANLQTIDIATLDKNNDTLIVKWGCKVLPFDGKPNVCNNPDYQTKLMQIIAGYIQEHGFTELAKRYACNIANARWLWRNRLGAENIEVTVSCQTDGLDAKIRFAEVKQYSLNSFDNNDEQLQQLTSLIEQGFSGQKFVILQIEAKAKVGYGQEVFPSQELVLDTGNSKSKILYQINNHAGLHSQKIGNAIRTIDTWYADDLDFPIAVEPYGAVTTLGTAFRQPKQKNDFYSLFDNWILKDEKPSVEQQHYVIAVLIRGGVFGASGKE